ncbi:MAG TPA: hypothetical protein VN132_04740 [Bdellovibrio sp.]|nr:hypothetical protein [Bdellovibrio sp.]
MRYSVADNIAQVGFCFYEKLQEPIFLFSKIGRMIRANEAGRKLLTVSHQSIGEIEALLLEKMTPLFFANSESSARVNLTAGFHAVARPLKNSDFILVEIRR